MKFLNFPPSATYSFICIRCILRAHAIRTAASLHSKHTTRAYARYHVYILCSRSTTGIDTFASWRENRPFKSRKLVTNICAWTLR